MTRRQIHLATFDQFMHTQPNNDLPAIYRVLSEQIAGIPATEGTDMSASFGHLAAGYAAQYYGYLVRYFNSLCCLLIGC